MIRRLADLHRHVLGATLAGALILATPNVSEAQPAGARPTVAIMYFNNGSLVDHDEYEPMRKGMADILITEMQSNPRIRVIERDALQKLLDEQKLTEDKRTDPATSARLGKILGAQHMIVGGFFIDRKGRMRLDARSVNVETSEVEHVETTGGDADDVLEVIAELARKLNSGLKLPGRPEGTRDRSPASTGAASRATPNVATASVPPAASPFKAMMTYARALSEDDAHNTQGALALYQQFLGETKPTFAVAQRQKAEERVLALSKA
ncbi:MAG: CsgG/HfaB family protein [Gemmatimonadota bacterium]